MPNRFYVIRTALIVALGGFLMGFDASVISGVVGFIETEFSLTKAQLGFSVASLTLTATLAMMLAGPIADRYGRKPVLYAAAVLYAISAIGSAFAPSFAVLVIARMIGGLGVGASLIIAPMYIAEIAPPEMRGQMVSFNQLNIVIGITVAFFSNYLILQWLDGAGESWRWMLGVETLPAILYFVGLLFVPNSPRWLLMKGRRDEALPIMQMAVGNVAAVQELDEIQKSMAEDAAAEKGGLKDLFSPSLRLVLTIGIVIGIIQQATGINAVFFYAPTIFEQSGIGTDAAFVQAIFVGVINLVFTLLAIAFIDRLGRRPLLVGGLIGITLAMALLAYGFGQATYTLGDEAAAIVEDAALAPSITAIVGQTYESDVAFKAALAEAIGPEAATLYEGAFLAEAADLNPTLILLGILGFVASFAISLGPVMWVLFSELFPNWIRGLAISFVGLINSAVSYLVQQVFPVELAALGAATTFAIFGVVAAIGLVFVWFVVPETKGKSLEELEAELVRTPGSSRGTPPA
ncbi:MAG: sugar porter family MFS transporter [Rubricoccaceae bacterium]|nr:sugar porter family MFS transporter [Rubricoccaceae bacterium]